MMNLCGIAGWVDFARDLSGEQQTVDAMGQTLAPRGPDDSGKWVSSDAAFVHRRLSVIDPEGGAQPMLRIQEDRTYVIVYNGELYNTDELRCELISRGHEFTTHSDTEVLLVAYIEWKEACVDHLNGIYAFAVWDEAAEKLFAARDRLGVKPFFFARRDQAFIFGSELKALLVHPEIEPAVDASGLAEVFALGPARTPGCGVFSGIRELKQGECLRWDRSGLRVWQYWSLVSHEHPDDLDTTIERIRQLVLDAGKRQLVSDVPLCTFLSGGLDSSILTVVASREFARQNRGQLNSYSIDYVDNDRYFQPSDFQPDQDAPWAEKVSRFSGTNHHRVLIDTPSLTDSLRAAVRARDLPGMADVDSSLYLFSRRIKQDATVALSGECADEVFGGYPWFWRSDAFHADTFPWSISQELRFSILSPELKEYIHPRDYLASRYQEALEEVPVLPGESHRQRRLREISYLTLTRWMPTLLDRKDRMSMAVGLEVRVPFCDHRLVEYTWNIPWEMKYYRNREKGLLRKAMEGVMPEEVLWRRKSPFPKTHNPGYLAATKAQLLDLLADSSSPLLPLVNGKELKRLAGLESDLNLPWFGQLMRLPQLFAYLIQVDFWLREYRVRIR